jgi:hypothetical protein
MQRLSWRSTRLRRRGWLELLSECAEGSGTFVMKRIQIQFRIQIRNSNSELKEEGSAVGLA